MEQVIVKGLLLMGAIISAWAAYKVIHEYIAERRKGTHNEPEAPYKIEFENPTVDVAIPDNPAHEAIKWTFANAPKPKRKYTKRDKVYWKKIGKTKKTKKSKTQLK